MSGRRRTAVLGLLSGALLLPAVPAAAAPASGSGSLPGIAQTVSDSQQGCVKASSAQVGRTPWPQTLLAPQSAWNLSEGGGVTVAVLGSGVNDSSGVLAGRLSLGPRENGSGDSGRDCVGYGTFVAGLIAAQPQAGPGLAGIAPQARILAVGVTDDTGATSAGALAKGIRAAVDGGARVVDVTVTVPGPSTALASAVAYAVRKGVLVVAPFGADGQTQAGTVYPAGYPQVLSVADLASGGSPPQNGALGGRVDLVAPGDAVMSVGPGGSGDFTATGPGLATAFVAGTAALVLGRYPSLTLAQLVRRLEATAYHPGTALPDPHLGYGTVDPVAAVTEVVPGLGGAPVPKPVPARAAGPVLLPAPTADPAADQAAEVAGAALLAVLLVALAATVLPRGRRRGWRPGRGPEWR